MIALDVDEARDVHPVAPSVGWTWAAVVLDLALWALIITFAACTPAKAGELPAIGARCVVFEDSGRAQPATLRAIEPGAGAIPWAWLTIDADPRRVVKLPASELRGCK